MQIDARMPAARLYDVYLDGQKVDLCTRANDDLGMVWHAMRDPFDPAGKNILFDAETGKVVIVCRRGDVEIRRIAGTEN